MCGSILAIAKRKATILLEIPNSQFFEHKTKGRTLSDPPNACGHKPNSVPLRVTIISLWTTVADGLEARYPSSTYGQQVAEDPPEDCLRLHAVGFAMPPSSPKERCALTAPFHPYRCIAAPAVSFLWHCPEFASKLVVVSHHRVLPCSDFPRPTIAGGDRLTTQEG